MDLEERISKARGTGKVDLLLINCRLVDVLSGVVRPATVAVAGGTIVGIDEDYHAEKTIDIGGKYLAPGLIDAHVHLESSMVAPHQFARAVIPRGTTAVVTDCHEIANVMGTAGIAYIMESAAALSLDVFVMLPPCVPSTPLETSGANLEADDLKPLLSEPQVKGLGELMNFTGTIAGDPGIMAKLMLFPQGPVDGHAPGLTGKDLCAYITAGPDSDHECTTADEAEEKLRKGMYVFLREGTGARNLADLLPIVNEENNQRCCLCIDDRHPGDLLERGHIDSMLKMAVGAGVSPITAIRMATLNTATRFRFHDRGAVSVSRRANMVVFNDLESFKVDMVFKDGILVAEGGKLVEDTIDGAPVPPPTVNVVDFHEGKLRIPAPGSGKKARVIGIIPDQIITETVAVKARVDGGYAVQDTGSDILKIAVVERHRGTGNVGVGFVKGFGLKEGALASTVAHDSHNIVVVGSTDADMAAAVGSVIEMGGGQVVVSGATAKASLALPIGGLMSPDSVEEVAGSVDKLNREAKRLGCVLSDPFMTMSFLALPVIPELKLTDKGLVDVSSFKVVPLFY